MTQNKIYAVNLKQIREDRGISVEILSNEIGVTVSAFRNYESGCTCPSVKALCRLADILGVSVDYLIGHDTKRCADTTVEQVCIYTGLSPEAVRGLHQSRGIRMIWRIRK